MEFEWDDAKAESNRRKHGVAFDDAIAIFDDPHAVERAGTTVSSETRTGVAENGVLLTIIYTWRSTDENELARVISARPASRRNDKAMAIVRYQRKPLTPEQIARLEKVRDIPDDQIDFSDIPDDDEGYGAPVRGAHYRPVKQQVTLRIDAPTLDWFKRHTPKGYQTDINRVLGEYVAQQEKKAG